MCLKQLDVTSCNTPGLTHIYVLPSVDGPVLLSPSTLLHRVVLALNVKLSSRQPSPSLFSCCVTCYYIICVLSGVLLFCNLMIVTVIIIIYSFRLPVNSG